MALRRSLAYLALAGGLAASASASAADEPAALALDDECAAATPGEEQEQCSLNALQRRGLRSAGRAQHTAARAARGDDVECKPLSAPENEECRQPVEWIALQNGKHDPNAAQWFRDMPFVTGMSVLNGTVEDVQRMYFCSPPGGKACGAPPCSCSKPPCDSCAGGAPPKKKRPGCDEDSTTVDCVPPKTSMGYKGVEWPTLTYNGVGEMHIFAVGDWGGLDGSLNPIEGRPNLVTYSWGGQPGPSPMIRSRWNKAHSVELCSFQNFSDCYDSHGEDCRESCGFWKEVDEQPQLMVAKAMEQRAVLKKPSFILNVGDNFYWGGIEKTCGTPMDEISFTAHHQFDQIFEGVYNGPGLAGAPWLSVLGNHDWGGRLFNNGWDQQIAYTWASDRWILPAPYYMVHVEYPDKWFSVDVFMLDTNFLDAKAPDEDPEHNICGRKHNPDGANCGPAGGPESVETCADYFASLWAEQQKWLEDKLWNSKATWQIAVTHFPCGTMQSYYYKLRMTYGLDLLVTGHRHDQELWKGTDMSNHMGGLTCFVTGGGGGITSEGSPEPQWRSEWYGEAQYGFFDITISKYMMTVESINFDGTIAKSAWVYPWHR